MNLFLSLKNLFNRKEPEDQFSLPYLEDELDSNFYPYRDPEYRDPCDIALDKLSSMISNKFKTKTKIKWNLFYKNPSNFKQMKSINFEAAHVNLNDWNTMQKYGEASKGNSDAYSYKFVILNKLNKIKMPTCFCSVSETITIKNNLIDVNCDTYATMEGVYAKALRAYYIEDICKFAVIYISYACL
jgi:hypothetical protein